MQRGENQATIPQLIANNMSGCFFLKHGVVGMHGNGSAGNTENFCILHLFTKKLNKNCY